MKAVFGSILSFKIAVLMSINVSGCAVTCIEDASGSTCTAKTLKRFDGPAQPPSVVPRTPGQPVTVEVQYGNILVERSTSGQVEVLFEPFAYAAYDDKAGADRELAQNLVTSVASTGGITVSVRRNGGSTGLGSDTIVRVPDDFDGALTVINHGDGPVNEFNVKVAHVGKASALMVQNKSMLGDCWIQGAPSIRTTSIQCEERIWVLDVSDQVNIENGETSFDDQGPAITLRLAQISPGSSGGKIITASGSISATFPSSGGYVLHAKSPVMGSIQEGSLPTTCAAQQPAPNAKTISCGQGPSYELLAGARPDYVGQPKESNVLLSYR
jgi:hypothetical protein